MFTVATIAAALVASLVALPLSAFAARWPRLWLACDLLAVATPLIGAFIAAAGADMWLTWEPPQIDAETAANMAPRARGRGGLFLLALQFWPYVMMAWGGYIAFATWQSVPVVLRAWSSGDRRFIEAMYKAVRNTE